MKNFNDTIGNRSHDLPVCGAVPQPLRHCVPPHCKHYQPKICSSRTIKTFAPSLAHPLLNFFNSAINYLIPPPLYKKTEWPIILPPPPHHPFVKSLGASFRFVTAKRYGLKFRCFSACWTNAPKQTFLLARNRLLHRLSPYPALKINTPLVGWQQHCPSGPTE
jgi:hypothetical protein